MSIIKGLFLGLKNQKVIPFNQMTFELHDQISKGLAKIMMAAKMTNAKLTKSQQNYIMNQAKQVQEFEDRYITKIKDKFGNLIKKEKVADVFDLEGKTLDPSKTIMGGTQEGAALKSGIMKTTKTGPKKVVTEGLSDKEFQDLRRSFRMNIAKNSPEFNQQLADKIIKRELYQDLSDVQRKDFLDNLDFVLKNPRGGSADGGRIGLKEGRIARILKSLKPFGSENKYSNQLEGILYGEMGFAEGLNLLSQSGLFAEGGRIGYKDGPKDPKRRTFMKIMAGIASLPVFSKFIGKSKVAKPIVKVAGSSTKMPDWFPDLINKVMFGGTGKKVDADLTVYEPKELPGISIGRYDDGRVFVEGENEYGKKYMIEYEPPGYELIDEKTGKAVKKKGEFIAQEEVPVNVDPDGNADFDVEVLDDLDQILGPDTRAMEEFATGKPVKEMKSGEFSLGRAEAEADVARDMDDYYED